MTDWTIWRRSPKGQAGREADRIDALHSMHAYAIGCVGDEQQQPGAGRVVDAAEQSLDTAVRWREGHRTFSRTHWGRVYATIHHIPPSPGAFRQRGYPHGFRGDPASRCS